MTDWTISFLGGFIVTNIFFATEFLREIEHEEKTIKEGLSHMYSRCDYRVFLTSAYVFCITMLTMCFYSCI